MSLDQIHKYCNKSYLQPDRNDISVHLDGCGIKGKYITFAKENGFELCQINFRFSF